MLGGVPGVPWAGRGGRFWIAIGSAVIPMARLGTPADIAAAAVFLSSAEAAYITGQTLHVNGGMAMI